MTYSIEDNDTHTQIQKYDTENKYAQIMSYMQKI